MRLLESCYLEADKAGLHVAYGEVFANPTPRKLARLVTGEGADEGNDEVTGFDYSAIDVLLEKNTLDTFRHGELQKLGNVLLTGATGYLGIHILRELIDSDAENIYCLVRGKNLEAAEGRLRTLLFYYFSDAFKDLFGKRLHIVLGDVTSDFGENLVASGNAYYAFDTAEELNERRAAAEAAGQTFIYNQKTRMELRNSLTLSAEETARLLEERTDWTVRFKMPEDTVVAMDDLIRGHIEVNTSTLDDKVLWKRADELPTYHLANIVDDHLMEISEVIRGEEWLPSLPLHYLLYKAFGWTDTQPRFAHLSLLLKPDGKGKLSKRDGDKLGFPVFPLRWVNPEGEVSRGYREDGYFPEAFVNLLAFLGWNPGDDREIFSLDELVNVFSLDRIVKSGARFNPEKARWYNREYLRMKSDEELAKLFVPVLEAHGVKGCSLDYVTRVVGLIKERATFVADFWDIASYLFVAPSEFVQKDVDNN